MYLLIHTYYAPRGGESNPKEIESALMDIEAIDQAVVLVKEKKMRHGSNPVYT